MEFNKEFFYIKGNVVDLVLIDCYQGDENNIPFYYYDIVLKSTNEKVGKISIRIGNNYHSYYNGNIGYEIDEKYRGNNYAYLASLMVLEVARYHNMDKINITCDVDNIASYKTIEKLGARLIEEAVPKKDYIFFYEGMSVHKIYELNINNKNLHS